MSTHQLVDDFLGSVGAAATRAPDEYPEWSSATYEMHMEDIRELWTELRPKLRNVELAGQIDEWLSKMFTAFDAGDKSVGRDLAWDIYNLGSKKVR